MNQQMYSKRLATIGLALLLAGARIGFGAEPAGSGGNDANVRFHGAPTYDFGVTNVKWEAATPEYSFVTFDLSWSYSWRLKWTEPAKSSCTGKDIEIENWDAAWVFVKFLPEKDSDEAKERNHWLHATLASGAGDHVMPAGATNMVKMSDDPSPKLGANGARGMGVFIYRDAVGHGVNNWKGIKLRWLHPPSLGSSDAARAGKFDPAKAAVAVHAIPMVYVPTGPFKVGSGNPSGIYAKFADGPDMPIVQTMNNIRTKNQEMGGLTDGSWRGGSTIPFLLDAEWDGPAAEGTHARRFGIRPGEIWGTHTYWEVNVQWIGGTGVLNDEYPTGYEAFYCMKYDLTQGQYVDFLNSLPPDVAAERAFVGSEVGSDAGMHSAKAKIDLGPGRDPYIATENGGCTIYSSADLPLNVEVSTADVTSGQDKKEDALDDLLADTFNDTKGKKTGATAVAAQPRPVYAARLPFRKLPGPSPSDTIAYAVWAGLRPMSQLEGTKAGRGARDPQAPADWTHPKDLDATPELLDEGLPTERYLKGNHGYGNSMVIRVGCRSTPTSDRGTALATYWGISELQGPVMPLTSRGYRGTHGNGMTSPGKPGASFKRVVAKFEDGPADWSVWGAYLGGHFVDQRCRLVVSADNRIKKPAGEESASAAGAAKPKPAGPIPPLDGRQDDLPRIANVKVEPGKEFSTVSLDLTWKNSWRAKWDEPAEKNVTGKPLKIESWDAAWVFLKFRRPDTRVFSHATLSPDAAHYVKAAGAMLEVGLSDDGAKGVGVFIYRDAIGQGANDFKGIKLRWQNGGDQADAATAEISAHAIAMVYVPEGSFRSKSPLIYTKGAHWVPEAYECKLMTIDTPDTTKPSGHVNFSTNRVREGPDWPNGYSAFYCMKYSISQGEYARFLTEAAPDPRAASYNGGQYGYLPHNASRRYAPGLYGLSGYTIRYSVGEGRYEADVPERPANFLSDPDIQSFTAWAGLRPLTKLEYEKACRGPRAAARDEDAWAPGACAPAAGLAQFVPSLGRQEAPATGRLAWPGPSYWGIRDLSHTGAIIEWPAVVIEDGRGFTGSHGSGSPHAPGDWVFTSRGEWYGLGSWQGFPLSEIGVWLLIEDYNRMPGDIGEYISTRSGRYGARAVRSAAGKADKDSPLQMEALPNMVGYDLAFVNLSGHIRNDGDKPLKVELVSSLPVSAFLRGSASRSFTAAAKAGTPFKVPLVLTRAFTNATERGGRGLLLPVQIKGPGGETLGEAKIRLSSDVLMRRPGAVRSLDGGGIELKVKNATENPLTLTFEMPSLPVVRIGESKRTLTVAAGGEGVVAFPVPRQWFPQEGPCRIPYRVAIGGGLSAVPAQAGAALDYETSVELHTQTRWWITKRVKAGPSLAGDGEDMLKGADDIGGLDGVFSEGGDVFTLAAPSKGWKPVTCGAAVALGQAGPLPSRDSKALGATRTIADAAADAVVVARAVNADGREISMRPPEKGEVPFFIRAWVNEALAFDSRLPEKERAKSAHIRKGVNTVVVEWQSNVDGESAAGNIAVQFNDAETGKPVPGLLLDMEKK